VRSPSNCVPMAASHGTVCLLCFFGIVLGVAADGSAHSEESFDNSEGSSCDTCGFTSNNDKHWDRRQKECVSEHQASRRLYSPQDLNWLLVTLQDLETHGFKFPGMIYVGRTIDFHHFLPGKAFSGLVAILTRIADLFSPFFHHVLLFPVAQNGTVADVVVKTLGMEGSYRAQEQVSHLLVHAQRDGVRARLGTFARPPKTKSYTFVGGVQPSWIKASLTTFGREPFSTSSWNCQHFAVRLFTDIAHACAASGMMICPPVDVATVFPSAISPAWCLPCQALGMTGMVIGPTALLLGFLCKLKKWSAKHADVPEA